MTTAYYRIDGKRLARARLQAFLTQVMLSEKSGISLATIQGLEQPRRSRRYTSGQRPYTVIALANAVGITPFDLLSTPSPQGNGVGKTPDIGHVKDTSQARQERGTSTPSRKALDLGLDLGFDLEVPQSLEPKAQPKDPRAIARSADPEAAGIRRQLRARLTERGVTSLPRDWHLKVDAVLSRWLRDGASPGELGDALEWGLTHTWFSDKLHDPGKLIDLLPQYQQRGSSNGKPSPHRLDQHYAALREMTDGR